MARTTNHGATTAIPAALTPFSLELMLQINVALLIVLGTSLLATGQQDLSYVLIALAGAATSVYITDYKRYFQLSPHATTTAAILACTILVVQVIRNVDQSHLLNVANVLIYLEMILLFQQKDDRAYWSLMALSLLQVVVAVALNLGLQFGAILVIYVLAAMSALVLFYVIRETRPFVSSSRQSDPRYAASRVGLLGSADESIQLAGLSEELAKSVLQPSLIRHVLRLLLLIVACTILGFFLFPRYGDTVWEGSRQDQVTTVGFTEEVELDNIGRLLENPEQVMRVEFVDLTGTPYQVAGEPYFRGSVLTEYAMKGVWKPYKSQSTTNSSLERFRPSDLASTIIQKTTLQQGAHSVLFHVAPGYFVDGFTGRNLVINPGTRQITVGNDQPERRGAFQYSLGTTAFRNGWQRDLLPATAPLSTLEQALYLDVDGIAEACPNLVATAARIAGADDPNRSAFDRANLLESHFRTPGEYIYSLEVNERRDRAIDPMEDFVTNHHTGHCEYFAGALTLMLRSQGIPARMIVGFKGGEFNTVGDYYIVRQLHAHAWVEAYLTNEQIPNDEWDHPESRENGAWLRLDPTPGSVDATVQNRGLSLIAHARELFDYCQVLWDDYVLGLNATRQQQIIYGPLMDSIRSLFSLEVWHQRYLALKQFAKQFAAGQVVSLPVFLGGTFLGSGLLWALVRARRYWKSWLPRWRPRWLSRRAPKATSAPRLDLYVRLERLLQRHGWHRTAVQTHEEFALSLRGILANDAHTATLADVPHHITAAYYRVRFGGQTIADNERRELTHAIDRLEQAVAERNQRRSTKTN